MECFVRRFVSVFTLVAFCFAASGSVVQAASFNASPLRAASIDQVAPAPTPPVGTFVPSPTYGPLGAALVVFTGGTVDALEVAAGSAGASGAWVQDINGRYQSLPVQGPVFLKSGFASAFPSASAAAPNFPQPIAVTLMASPVVVSPSITVTAAQNGTTRFTSLRRHHVPRVLPRVARR